ncbi:hypothetical protein DFA_00875 [Cavenderia fasciculata]|uniref:Uncharacterized protein n=1 Tax=Cavenderia fasciculata TaxID=261658 RepID=F4PUD4_CACFS|nr:uncharacterized protein DFA_00875 [Cavenderia fasciculata]EGG21006.1 hypothetical protein DFA_00875 [Cavenderia fasciculata]|eukprot:XP_004358856.1 hypothetical protein DFA_00875 [Cavenderia fasciculata]
MSMFHRQGSCGGQVFGRKWSDRTTLSKSSWLSRVQRFYSSV